MPLTRRELLNISATTIPIALVSSRLFASNSASSVYETGFIIDGLGGPGGLGLEADSPLSELEIEHVRASGLTAVHITVGNVGTMAALESFEKTVRDITRWEKEIDTHEGVLTRIRSVADLKSAKSGGEMGLIYGLQDGVSFEDDPDRLNALHQLGVRVIQPTYNRRNLLGDGCMEPADAGMSRVGIECIERMNSLGVLVDLSHCGRRTAADAIAASKRPVSFTHTGCNALAEHPRHRTDAELRAVAETGGVSGIYIMPYLAKGKQPTATDVIHHIEHAVNVAGEDHVSIGTDGNVSPMELTQDYIDRFREGTRERARLGIAAPYETETGYLFANDLNTPRRLETLAQLLMDRGHSETFVTKVLGANLLRLFGDTWIAS
jgi:membrane dipeptidase